MTLRGYLLPLWVTYLDLLSCYAVRTCMLCRPLGFDNYKATRSDGGNLRGRILPATFLQYFFHWAWVEGPNGRNVSSYQLLGETSQNFLKRFFCVSF